MKIRITSISEGELGEKISNFTQDLQRFLSSEFKSKDYGADVCQLTIVYVVVDDRFDVNQKFAEPHDKCSRFKDVNGNWVRSIGAAVVLRPELLRSKILSDSRFQAQLRKSLVDRLEQPINRVPKDFKIDEFLENLRGLLIK